MEISMRPSNSPPLPPRPEEGGLIVDLFAGPGGWSTGLRAVGLHDIGVEWDPAACATRIAEGHLTIRGDVSKVPTEPFRGRTWMLLASPPCQSFGVAGKKQGRPTAFLDALAGRYDASYAIELRRSIGGQQAARDAWERAWRLAADEHGWWDTGAPDVPDDALLPASRRRRALGAAATPRHRDGLSPLGAAERERLYGPAPRVEDERGMYMAETVRWVTELDHPAEVALDSARTGGLLAGGKCITCLGGVVAGQRARARGRPRINARRVDSPVRRRGLGGRGLALLRQLRRQFLGSNGGSREPVQHVGG